MAMPSTLCQLCQTIPLNDLPRFPDDSYGRGLSGMPKLHTMWHFDTMEEPCDPLGFHYHDGLESLRSASASGCELCRLVEIEADALLVDIAERNLKYAKYPEEIKQRHPLDPSFDLWITQRPEGGDGFWVIAKSMSEPKKRLFLVATFGFGSENDDPLALTFCGRPVNGPPDRKVLDRAVSWVTHCNKAHGGCTTHDYSMPTRVIDVGMPGGGSTVKLIEVEEGTKGQYIALSYCWGVATKQFTTTRSSLPLRKAGMHLSDLPQTFQDAVAMVRVLGVRYLWIDSICICQDDLMDWEKESARMAGVYSNAYLTIAATGQPNSSGGLFFERPTRTYLRLPLKTASDVEGHVLIFPLHKSKEFIKSHRVEMRSEPLAERAWAFQERVLSRRVIHFASDQIYFECLEGSVNEEGLRLPERYFSIYLGQLGETVPGGKDKSPPGSVARFRCIPGNPQAHWAALLLVYSSRKLTYPADKLPALAGIAKVYSQLLDDEYVAGLWRKSMILGLCWQSVRCEAVSGGYRAPSWSWASVDGPAFDKVMNEDKFDPIATILDYHVEIDGDNPFGRVKSGWIKIEAPIVPLAISEYVGLMGNIHLRTEMGDESGTPVLACFDTIKQDHEASATMVRDMKLYALTLVAVRDDPANREEAKETNIGFYQTIIVTPAEAVEASTTSVDLMKRVGWMVPRAEFFAPGELNASRATVTLI